MSDNDAIALRQGFPADLRRRIRLMNPTQRCAAHEIWHHIQNLMGITQRVARADQQDPPLTNGLAVRDELQADCMAGVWAHSTYERNLLATGFDSGRPTATPSLVRSEEAAATVALTVRRSQPRT